MLRKHVHGVLAQLPFLAQRPFPARRRRSASKQRGAICPFTPRARVTITRRETYAVVVAKLGFKPAFISRAGNKDVSRRQPAKDGRFAGNPARLHQGFKALGLARRTHG